MIKLFLDGYGGEYLIGKLTEKEINNIKLLLNRFNPSLFLNGFCLSFGDDRYQFNDFDDVYSGWGPTDGINVTDETGYIEFDFMDADAESEKIEIEETGYYIMTCSIEKGRFCSLSIDGTPEKFDVSKLILKKDQLYDTWLKDSVITGASYYGVELEFDYDYVSTSGKSFEQAIQYYDADEDEFHTGEEKLSSLVDPKYKIINEIPFGDEYSLFEQYLEIANKTKPLDEFNLEEGAMAFYSPMIADLYGKDACKKLWLSDKSHIKFAKEYGIMDTVPNDIRNTILKTKPEWLI